MRHQCGMHGRTSAYIRNRLLEANVGEFWCLAWRSEHTASLLAKQSTDPTAVPSSSFYPRQQRGWHACAVVLVLCRECIFQPPIQLAFACTPCVGGVEVCSVRLCLRCRLIRKAHVSASHPLPPSQRAHLVATRGATRNLPMCTAMVQPLR